MKKILEFTKFSFLGGLGVFAGFCILFTMTNFFGVWYIFSSLTGEIGNYFISFYVHKFWTFQDKERERTKKELIYYFLVIMGYFLVNTSLMYILTDLLKIQYLWSKLILVPALSLPNYWATKKVFKP